jgi:hypothetical protein
LCRKRNFSVKILNPPEGSLCALAKGTSCPFWAPFSLANYSSTSWMNFPAFAFQKGFFQCDFHGLVSHFLLCFLIRCLVICHSPPQAPTWEHGNYGSRYQWLPEYILCLILKVLFLSKSSALNRTLWWRNKICEEATAHLRDVVEAPGRRQPSTKIDN